MLEWMAGCAGVQPRQCLVSPVKGSLEHLGGGKVAGAWLTETRDKGQGGVGWLPREPRAFPAGGQLLWAGGP